MSEVPGPVLFARYAFPPNALGYCGPADRSALVEAASTGGDLTELRSLAARFEGAWPYLEVIARCHGIADPLDPRVVEAYWIGNELALSLPPSALTTQLERCFGTSLDCRSTPLGRVVAAGGVSHHSLHVFAVYPWLAILRSVTPGPALGVLDRCRIRWGRVERVRGERVWVRSAPLCFDDTRLTLGRERIEEARRPVRDLALGAALVPGDLVALHWNWVCDRLSSEALSRLSECTMRNLEAVNSGRPPVAAAGLPGVGASTPATGM